MNQSYIYNLEGEIHPLSETYHGKPFFRKMIHSYEEEDVFFQKIHLNSQKCKNIVEIYNIQKHQIDMELVNTEYILTRGIIKKMRKVKDYLHSINIAYMDWKRDNIGIGIDGEPKLFDFDCSGIFGEDRTWIVKPYPGYAYHFSIHLEDPIKMDNACFDRYLAELCV